jgi:hypothetical protein
MRLIRALSIFGAALITLGTAAFAQSPTIETTPIPMTAKTDFSKMAFLSGTWNCSVMSSRRPTPYHVTSVSTLSTDGYWMVTRSTTQKTSWIARTLTTEDKMTYDPSTSRWVDVSTDDSGGYDVSSSPGWNGDSIVWTDLAYPQSNATAVNNPTTLTKVSDTETTSVSSFKEPSGRLVTVKSSCTKAS